MKKLFLFDAMALIYRAHFAFAKTPRISSKGINTSAVFGFANTILEVINKEKPDYLGVAFDTPKPTFRHIEYTPYKAQRQEQPEDITIAIPYVKRLVEAMDIPMLILDGYEADDVIGTIAKKAVRANPDIEVYMMTPDKDYGQLVEERIKMYKPAFMGKGVEVLGPKEVCQRWNIANVDQVIDMLGLMGDAVDNIPGIPGVGEKTAQKLIEQFGSLENLLDNTDQLKGKLQENLINFREQGILSKHLARIMLEVPIEYEEEKLKATPPNRALLEPLLEELEFRTLRKRILGEDEPVVAKVKASPKVDANQMDMFGSPAPSTATTPDTEEEEVSTTSYSNLSNTAHQYHLVQGENAIKSLISFLDRQDSFCFDTETTSLVAIEAALVGMSFSYRKGEAFYVPFPEDPAACQAQADLFKAIFAKESTIKIAQNIKYDMSVLRNYGIEIKGATYDTMLAHYLIEPEKRHGMDALALAYLSYEPMSIENLIGKKGAKQGNMREVELNLIKEYAAEDADITLQLKPFLDKQLTTNPKAVQLLHEVEMPLARVLSTIECEGVNLDVPFLQEMSKTLEADSKAVQEKIFATAGQEFNIASPKQLGEILFEKLKLDPKAKKTKTGQYMTGEEVLTKLEAEHEIASLILDFRELQKLKSTYVDALPALISPKTGRIHTSFMQAVTATGRLSSKDPNLQNIPIRTVRGREIRKAFIPRDENHLILSADYSQIELRIMAAFSKDESMLDAFNNGLDVHKATAAKVFHVPLEEVTSDMRRKAKTVNFGIIYGVSAFGLAAQLAISRTEAKEIIDQYFVEFPKVKTFMDQSIADARENGYVETVLGRRRYLRDILSANMNERGFAERNAINAPIQGSAADMIKVAMIQIQDFLERENLKSKMILTVHDELVFDAHKDEVDYLKTQINKIMCEAMDLGVAMETGIGVGENWLEAH
ncbi:DNA polymerase I [Aquirufa antheringensis]|jgi:DNA polymerase-1|uniref:DNA polymerase I n=1 Tax=Aquirufa antheringensis TaxID=2516559 RepID=A0A4V2IVN4_9BACT|nr:DNA polymerase I [Aquirufa antheringensis]MCZ2484035.1 DNA polymerase I [Aquirufa antheringensis]TBH72975.1 DNA polymerase I [Aquirufa antheringensis]